MIWTGGSLVEVVGHAGAGKMQMALKMAIHAALPWAAAAASLPPPHNNNNNNNNNSDNNHVLRLCI